MCGIAGAFFRRPIGDSEMICVMTMASALKHRGPDDFKVKRAGEAVLAVHRLAIVDSACGGQPFINETGNILNVFNGEIYNYRGLRELLLKKGHVLLSDSDGEVIGHLYEEYGKDCVDLLDGQFAFAISDIRARALLLARDRMGICPMYWVDTPDAFYFCSEIKGLLAAGVVNPKVRPEAIVQISYFGNPCAPLTPFAGVHALPPAHLLWVDQSRAAHPWKYWTLKFPRIAEHRHIAQADACAELQDLIEVAVATHSQGEFPAACFLSGGIDSAIIAANLSRRSASDEPLESFCVTSSNPKFDEQNDAKATAKLLGINFNPVAVDEPAIAGLFARLIWHAETPVLSTEAAALLLLAGQVRERTKIVLTGEGADEAFGGYLAFRQYKLFGSWTQTGLIPLRTLVRPLLRRHYGSDFLLPHDSRIRSVKSQLGYFPAQAYEWEFYREACLPVLSRDYRALHQADAQWKGLTFNYHATEGLHWLNKSLLTGYQFMLPNYLLSTHGDRVFAANSIEGRYPFLSRGIVEFAATLPPEFKLRRLHEKYLLRRAAECWLPRTVVQRPKRRFMMPFGTPFLGPDAPDLFRYLTEPETLRAFGYFDPAMVLKLLNALSGYPQNARRTRTKLERLALGIAATFVVSTQLWHHIFIDRTYRHQVDYDSKFDNS